MSFQWRLSFWISVVLTANSCLLVAQDDRLQITTLNPLYCFDIIEGSDRHVVKVFNYECVDRLQLTFQNSDQMRIRNVIFILSLSETKSGKNLTIYRNKHRIDLEILPEAVVTYDLKLPNPIAPPEGERDFSNRTTWKWSAEIVSVNTSK